MTIPAMEIGDETPTALYRLYDAEGALLYVGITGNIKARFARHAVTKPWWPEVARKTVQWHLRRASAAEAELKAIQAEGPLHNKMGAVLADGEFDPADFRGKITSAAVLALAFGDGTSTERLIRIVVAALGELPEGPAVDVLADRLGLTPRMIWKATARLRRSA